MTFHLAVRTADLAEGAAVHVVIGDRQIAVVHVDGGFYALGGICTHGNARLANGFIERGLIECPLHGGTFDIKTGRAVDIPCTVNTKSYAVRVDDGTVFVGIEDAVAPV